MPHKLGITYVGRIVVVLIVVRIPALVVVVVAVVPSDKNKVQNNSIGKKARTYFQYKLFFRFVLYIL